MKTYQLKYNGNSRMVKRMLNEEPVIVSAETLRQAVEEWYSSFLNEDYFVHEETGNVVNQAGNIVAAPNDDCFKYDGGEIWALPVFVTGKVTILKVLSRGTFHWYGSYMYDSVVYNGGHQITETMHDGVIVEFDSIIKSYLCM